MPFIIRQNKAKVYVTGEKRRLTRLTYQDKETADKIDRFLQRTIPEIEEKLSLEGSLKFKGKAGAIELWYRVGIELRRLWDIVRDRFGVSDTDLKLFIRAVYDHTKKINPGPGRLDRLSTNPLYYCYQLAGFPEKLVKNAGNWTAWVEFLDSPRVRNDPRITEWFISRSPIEPPRGSNYIKLKWFRVIMRSIRNEFRKIDTTILEKGELFEKLDKVLANIQENQA